MQNAIAKARTIPSYFYTCREHFRREMETVFMGNNWIHVGRLDQLKNIGDYISGKIYRQPYMLTRSSNAQVMAYDNVCRHHGTTLAKEGSGQFSNGSIICCYHGWTYSLDGKLIRATRLRGIEDFRPKNYGLHQLKMRNMGELIFLNFGQKAAEKAENAENSENDRFFPLDMMDFKQLQFVATRTYKLDCNWKVFVDNYLDGGYHVEHAHRDLASNLDMKTYKTEIFDRYNVQSVSNKASDDNNRYNKPASYIWLYPNVMLNRYGKWLDTNTVYPLDAEKCAVVFDWYLEKDEWDNIKAQPMAIEEALKASNQVQEEDEELCARVQAGMHSKFYQHGRYAPNVEMGMYHFHDLLLKDLQMTIDEC